MNSARSHRPAHCGDYDPEVAVLWSDDDWTTQISQEFATKYKFVRP